MRILRAIRTCLFEKYAQFKGRASRSEFWWFDILVNGLCVSAIYLSLPHRTLIIAIILILLITFIPLLAASVRRLHDIGRSGLWLLLALIPYLGGIIVLWLLATRGTPGENTYGPDPLAKRIPVGPSGEFSE